jgi:hypothetical protein
MTTTETIAWTPIEQGPPDAGTTVLISLDESHNEPTWTGFYDGARWCDVSGMPITGVVGWAHMPGGMRHG